MAICIGCFALDDVALTVSGQAAFKLPAAPCRKTHGSRQLWLATAFYDDRDDTVRNHLFVAQS